MAEKKYSIKDIINSTTEEKNKFNNSFLWWKIAVKYPAAFLTKFFLWFKINPNSVTSISVLIGLIGLYLIAFGKYSYNLFGILLVYIWQLLDDVDGNIARITDCTSKYGEFLDDLGAIIMYGFLFYALGINVALNPDIYVGHNNYFSSLFPYNVSIFITGSMCSILCVLRLYQNFLFNKVVGENLNKNSIKITSKERNINFSLVYNLLRSNILEFMGFLLPIVFISHSMKNIDYILILYFSFFLFDFLLSTYAHLSRLKYD